MDEGQESSSLFHLLRGGKPVAQLFSRPAVSNKINEKYSEFDLYSKLQVESSGYGHRPKHPLISISHLPLYLANTKQKEPFMFNLGGTQIKLPKSYELAEEILKVDLKSEFGIQMSQDAMSQIMEITVSVIEHVPERIPSYLPTISGGLRDTDVNKSFPQRIIHHQKIRKADVENYRNTDKYDDIVKTEMLKSMVIGKIVSSVVKLDKSLLKESEINMMLLRKLQSYCEEFIHLDRSVKKMRNDALSLSNMFQINQKPLEVIYKRDRVYIETPDERAIKRTNKSIPVTQLPNTIDDDFMEVDYKIDIDMDPHDNYSLFNTEFQKEASNISSSYSASLQKMLEAQNEDIGETGQEDGDEDGGEDGEEDGGKDVKGPPPLEKIKGEYKNQFPLNDNEVAKALKGLKTKEPNAGEEEKQPDNYELQKAARKGLEHVESKEVEAWVDLDELIKPERPPSVPKSGIQMVSDFLLGGLFPDTPEEIAAEKQKEITEQKKFEDEIKEDTRKIVELALGIKPPQEKEDFSHLFISPEKHWEELKNEEEKEAEKEAEELKIKEEKDAKIKEDFKDKKIAASRVLAKIFKDSKDYSAIFEGKDELFNDALAKLINLDIEYYSLFHPNIEDKIIGDEMKKTYMDHLKEVLNKSELTKEMEIIVEKKKKRLEKAKAIKAATDEKVANINVAYLSEAYKEWDKTAWQSAMEKKLNLSEFQAEQLDEKSEEAGEDHFDYIIKDTTPISPPKFRKDLMLNTQTVLDELKAPNTPSKENTLKRQLKNYEKEIEDNIKSDILSNLIVKDNDLLESAKHLIKYPADMVVISDEFIDKFKGVLKTGGKKIIEIAKQIANEYFEKMFKFEFNLLGQVEKGLKVSNLIVNFAKARDIKEFIYNVTLDAVASFKNEGIIPYFKDKIHRISMATEDTKSLVKKIMNY